MFQKCWNHLQIQGAREVTLSNFLSKDPHTSGATCEPHCYLAVACSAYVNRYTFTVRGKTAVVVLKISGATLHNLDARATKRPEFVHPFANI